MNLLGWLALSVVYLGSCLFFWAVCKAAGDADDRMERHHGRREE